MKNSAEFLSAFTSRSYAKRKNKAPDLPYSVQIIGNKTYYYLVEGKRDEQGKVKQKVLKYLGSPENVLEKFKFWEENH